MELQNKITRPIMKKTNNKHQASRIIDSKLKVNHLSKNQLNGFVANQIEEGKAEALEYIAIPELYDLIKRTVPHLSEIKPGKIKLNFENGGVEYLIQGELESPDNFVFDISAASAAQEIQTIQAALYKIMLQHKEITFSGDYETILNDINISLKAVAESTKNSTIFLFSWYNKFFYWDTTGQNLKANLISSINASTLPFGLSVSEQSFSTNKSIESEENFYLITIKDISTAGGYICLGIKKADLLGAFYKPLENDLKMFAYVFFYSVKRLWLQSVMPTEMLAKSHVNEIFNRSDDDPFSDGNFSKKIGTDVLVMHETNGTIIRHNDVFSEWFGYNTHELSLFEIFEDLNSLDDIKSKYRNHEDFVYEAVIKPINGKVTIPVKVHSSPMLHEKRIIYYSLIKDIYSITFNESVSTPDVEEYKQIASELCNFVYGYRVDLETGNFIMDWFKGDKSDFPFANPKDIVENMNKYLQQIHPDDLPIVFRKDEMISGLKNHSCMYRFQDSRGRFRWIKDYHWYLGKGKDGLPVFCGAVQDYSKEVSSKKELELLKTAINNSSNVVLILNQKGHIEYVNPSFYQESGIEPDSVIDKHISILDKVIIEKNSFDLISNPSTGSTNVINHKVSIKNSFGVIQQFIFTTTPIYYHKKIDKYVIIGQNVTKVIELENQIINRDKLNTIGLLTSGVAHDLNNIIQIIESYTELIALKLDPGSQLINYTQSIQRALHRGSDLVSSVLDYGKPDFHNHKEELLFEEALKDALIFLKPFLPDRIRIEENIEKGIQIIANRVHLQQILVNLIMNSVDAISEKDGVIWIRMKKDSIQINGFDKKMDCLLISISDNGVGMNENLVKKIFSPYFTTRKPSKNETNNFGLGLFIVDSIVNDYDGKISVQTAVGEGTTFNIHLPVLK